MIIVAEVVEYHTKKVRTDLNAVDLSKVLMYKNFAVLNRFSFLIRHYIRLGSINLLLVFTKAHILGTFYFTQSLI
jgi:hypothetical protein